MAATTTEGFFSSVYHRFQQWKNPAPTSQHPCIDPSQLFLLGKHLTALHHLCLRCNVSNLPKKPRNSDPNISGSPQKNRRDPVMPSTIISSGTHLNLGDFAKLSVNDVKMAIKDLSAKRQDVESISVQDDVQINSKSFSKLKVRFPGLQGLQVRGTQLENSEMINAIAATGVKNLDFSNSKLTDDGLIQLVKQNPGIENLDISNCGLLTDRGFGCLSHLTNLKSLKASQMINVTLEGFKKIPVEKLEYLDLSYSWPLAGCVGDDLCQCLSNAKQLRYVNFAFESGNIHCSSQNALTEVGLSLLAQNNPLLETLIMTDNYQGAPEGLMAWKNMSNLVELEFSRIYTNGPGVPEDVFSMLGTLPKLKFLRLEGSVSATNSSSWSAFAHSKIEQLWATQDVFADGDFNTGVSFLPSTLVDLRIGTNNSQGPLPSALSKSLAKFTNLQSLGLQNYILNGELIAESWEGNFKNLKALNFSYGDALGFEVVCKNSSKIESVTLDLDINPIGYEAVKPLATLKNLRAFTVNGQLPQQFLVDLLTAKPPLENLDLTNCLSTSAVIELLPNVATTLKTLFLMYSSSLNNNQDSGLQNLSHLVNLRHLSLWGDFKPEDYSFLPSLPEVNFLFITDMKMPPIQPPGTIPPPIQSASGVNAQVLEWIGEMPKIETIAFQLTDFGNDALQGLVSRPLKNLTIHRDLRTPRSLNDGAESFLSQITSLETLNMDGQLSVQALKEFNRKVHPFYSR